MVMIGIVTGLWCPTSPERAHGVPPLTPFALAANVDCVLGVMTTADAARVAAGRSLGVLRGDLPGRGDRRDESSAMAAQRHQ